MTKPLKSKKSTLVKSDQKESKRKKVPTKKQSLSNTRRKVPNMASLSLGISPMKGLYGYVGNYVKVLVDGQEYKIDIAPWTLARLVGLSDKELEDFIVDLAASQLDGYL